MVWDSIIAWIMSHLPQILSQIVTEASGVKTVAETIDSVRKLMVSLLKVDGKGKRCMAFYLFHQQWRDFFFRLSYSTSHPQMGIHVNGDSTPKSSSFFFFWLPPFSPLCPTYVHRASICTRLSL